ncbi:cyclin-dependent kinase inhibitor dacapo [Megachile rotundata]|uniref:cyclin-dependent kinase inhibitor dacapo n=1 Tax=Megachile rotundata TaxID=143995 RepID=UPI000614F7E0|nr:PREDICTED: cyclin-dependent kinase inhibitor 1 isoform X1 [Megachile rotundata]XP_012138340.1 PREDICTED: cyclin-dependent kinase inhibitor 1 isoform X2 [Megachile rotundata]
MSARVLNPVMMTEMSRNLGGGRTVPSRAALARVRRDLFGPVDHAAARALAERELRAQSMLDAERWGFDFHLEIPKANSRYEWELVTSQDVVPEPYALRGMPYLRKHAPSTPRKVRDSSPTMKILRKESPKTPILQKTERTPPQEPRVPQIGEVTMNDMFDFDADKKMYIVEPTTPVLSTRKQSTITDYMKSRKRSLNGSAKSMIEPPEKIARNAGQIRS